MYISHFSKNFKVFLSILVLTNLMGCNNERNGFYYCASKAGLFYPINPLTISLDTINNLKNFKAFEKKLRDTISKCTLLCGFVYNFEDSSFNSNSDSSKNIVITSFHIASNHCVVDYISPSLEIFLNNRDSVEIYTSSSKSIQRFHISNQGFRTVIDSFYNNATNLEKSDRSIQYIHFVIPDTLDFNRSFLPCFKILINAYKINIEKYMNQKELNICDTVKSKTEIENTFLLRFRLKIDDWDDREFRNK